VFAKSPGKGGLSKNMKGEDNRKFLYEGRSLFRAGGANSGKKGKEKAEKENFKS